MAVGDVILSGNDGRSYTLNFGVNAMCRLEDLDPQKRTYREVLLEMQTGRPSMRTVRTVVAAALVEPKDQTLEQVGDVIEDIGGVLVVLGAFVKSDDAIAASIDAQIRTMQQQASAAIAAEAAGVPEPAGV
jgi:hypothetical protein